MENNNYTFTPYGKKEEDKVCTGCKRTLSAKNFKLFDITKDDIKGIARKNTCKDCENRQKVLDSFLEDYFEGVGKMNIEYSSMLEDMAKEYRRLSLN